MIFLRVSGKVAIIIPMTNNKFTVLLFIVGSSSPIEPHNAP